MRLALAGLMLVLASACASAPSVGGGPRPPQGPGPAGTDFGFWNRDAEGSVDVSFRTYISKTYDYADEAKAKINLEKDGFTCRDGNRPDARPVPDLECERVYQLNDDIHAWNVKFWPNLKEPESHYSRTHILDRNQDYNERQRAAKARKPPPR